MTYPEKLLYQIALTQITGVGDKTARNLLKVVGNEEEIFKSSRKSLLTINGLGSYTVDEILNKQVLLKAEKELAFVEQNKLKTYFVTENDYPRRLLECDDAPILLYYKGLADFNAKKVVSVVGTRNSSNYGNSFCDTFLDNLANIYPDALIVSGLAYGIDINAHRAALSHGLPTIGVLAHGLDRIYPSVHRKTAVEMIDNGGGLLTEFVSGTSPDKFNFVRRNRIVAGMADAVIVVESNERGGSLITAEIANSYCRDVFAVPGRMNDMKSVGCNKLVAEHKADLLLSFDYFLSQMGWDKDSEKRKKQPNQKELFIDLSSEEQKIVDVLSSMGNLHVDSLSSESQIPTYLLFSILLELEMKGVIQCLPGSTYALL